MQIERDLLPLVDADRLAEVDECACTPRLKDMQRTCVFAHVAILSNVLLVALFPAPCIDEVVALRRVAIVERTVSHLDA